MDLKYFLLAAFLTGLLSLACAQSEPSVDDVYNNLPPELQGKLNASDVEVLKNKSQELFKEKCEKNGGPEAYESAQKAYEKFPTCVKDSLGLDDPKKLQEEIEAAKPNGAVDEVFKKYCQKTPEAKQCFKDMAESVKPCFKLDEQKNMQVVYNISEQLAEFICFKDGDRIALFIAEGGPECIQDKQELIQDCVKNTFGDEYNFDPNNVTASAIPEINFGEKECKQLNDLQLCVVSALEKCAAPTSANIVESLFKFARQATPCKTEAPPKGSAVAASLSTAVMLLALAAIL
ncbi:hypothetical protein O0L34_g17593 [Tuta absoluta]|nr:hypothetical protein O0L34_g17593 [Tuta absoluta]